MNYADLIEIMKPYAGEEVWFGASSLEDCCQVVFYAGDDHVVALGRKWGTDKVELI